MTPPADFSGAVAWAEQTLGPVVAVEELTGGWTSTMLGLSTESGRAVLRLMTNEPWRTHGEGLTTREAEVQRTLAATAIPAPRSLALDAAGEHCGHPAHLMTLLPGRVDLSRRDSRSLGAVAEQLAAIHDIGPTIEVRDYQSWAWEAKYVVPSWAADGSLWERAFDVLRSPAPDFEPTFIHRDFQPRNLLWTGGAITGVVDWPETSMGPAWLDVAHCATNLALRHGTEVADEFERAYSSLTGRAAEPYFDVMDIVGFLPPPGRQTYLNEEELARLDRRLATVLPHL